MILVGRWRKLPRWTIAGSIRLDGGFAYGCPYGKVSHALKKFAGQCAVWAGVAQLVEHLICNQRVGGSNPFVSSILLGQPERVVVRLVCGQCDLGFIGVLHVPLGPTRSTPHLEYEMSGRSVWFCGFG